MNFAGKIKSLVKSGGQGPASPEVKVDTQAGMNRALKFAQKKASPHEVMAKKAIEDMLLTVEKAIQGIDGIRQAIRATRDLSEAALAVTDSQQMDALRSETDSQLKKINDIAAYCTVADQNLIDGHQSQFIVPLSDYGSSTFLIVGTNLTCAGLGLRSGGETFQSPDTLEASLADLARAESHLKHSAETYCANAAMLARHYQNMR